LEQTSRDHLVPCSPPFPRVLKWQNSIWERKSSKSKIGKITEEKVTSCTFKKQSRKKFIINGRDARTVADKI